VRRVINYEKIVPILFSIITTCLIIAHYITSEPESGLSRWLLYGMLLFSVYILIAWKLKWTIILPYGGSAEPKDKGGRIFSLAVGLIIYFWVIYSLFFGK
jgi:hypothetical protein